MRIVYPERIPVQWATVFATALFCVQLVQHTDVFFALCCFGYILVATVAFNLAGGLYRPPGAYIFFNATLTMIVGLMTKAVFGEPANSNLRAPIITVEVYLLGMVAMLIAAYVETRYRTQPALISRFFSLPDLRSAYIGAAAVGILAEGYYLVNPVTVGGTFAAAFRNANSFIPFAIIVGVIHTVRSTNGRRSVTLPLLTLMGYQMASGLLLFSKQGLFTPLAAWCIGASLSRYKIKSLNYVAFAVLGLFAVVYAVPFIQYGKGIDNRAASWIGNIELGLELGSNIDNVRKSYKEQSEDQVNLFEYFDEDHGLFSRLNMLGPDDALIDLTDRAGTFGYEPVIESMQNLIPHVFWPNKPVPFFGNVYAHQIGVLSEDDHSTGIAFGISADMYHQGGWVGVMFVETACLIAVFLVLSRTLGDVRDHPAVIISVLVISHQAPEGAVGGLFVLILNSWMVLMLAFTCRYVLPVFAHLLEPRRQAALTPTSAVVLQ